jgi:hypothetical protein
MRIIFYVCRQPSVPYTMTVSWPSFAIHLGQKLYRFKRSPLNNETSNAGSLVACVA